MSPKILTPIPYTRSYQQLYASSSRGRSVLVLLHFLHLGHSQCSSRVLHRHSCSLPGIFSPPRCHVHTLSHQRKDAVFACSIAQARFFLQCEQRTQPGRRRSTTRPNQR